MLGLGLGMWSQQVTGGGGGGLVTPFASVNAEGWSAEYAATPPTFNPDSSPVQFTVSRQGFDASGNAATISETMTVIRRKRQAYPNQASETALSVALSDYIYSTDTISGATNNSTVASPKPIANWVMPDRSLVGDTIDWEIVAFHRNARSRRMVACVQVQATDGTNTTAWQTVSATAISSLCEDANPVEVFKGALDISGLNTGLITLRGKVIPFIGGSGSILDSNDSSVAREFSPRYFLRNTSRAASPPYAYVSSTGNDSTGVWSTTAATAEATPFLTVGGALTAVNDAVRGTPATGGVADGGRIRIVDTVSLGTTASSRPQNVAAVIVERAPGTSRASAICTLTSACRLRLGVGTLTAPLTEGAIRFYDMTLSRTVNTTFTGEAATQINLQWHNVTIANASTAGTWLANAHNWFYGVNLTGFNGQLGQTTLQHRIMRGLVVDFANGTAPEGWVTVGCTFTRVKGVGYSDPSKPAIHFANKYLNPDSTTAAIGFNGAVSGGNLGGIAVVQNLFEVTHTTSSTPCIRISSDSAFGNITHAVVAHNTVTGYGSVGRNNVYYDEHPTVARSHALIREFGNITAQLNTKGDVFQSDGTRLGQFAYHHGVGCQGNFSQFAVNSGTAFSELQAYPGLKSNIGTSTSVRNDPLFTNYQGTGGSGGTPSSGAGGGTYTLQSGSPCKSLIPDPVLAFDLGGNARPATNDAAGAYA